MESFVCAACHSVVSSARREAHETTWCPALADPSDEDSPAGDHGQDAVAAREAFHARHDLGGARALISSLYQEEIAVPIGSMQGVAFTFEQTNIWGPLDTGGALWYADRLLAEYVAINADGTDKGVALVLGCGGVPLSGLAASAAGWEVVLTDLELVLDQTRRNVERNLEVLRCTRQKTGREYCEGSSLLIVGADTPPPLDPRIHVRELPFGESQTLEAALWESHLLHDPAGSMDGLRHRRLLVLCSDCIWQPVLHEPLLNTIGNALRLAVEAHVDSHDGPKSENEADLAAALIAYQTRNPQVEKTFFERIEVASPKLKVASVDVKEALKFVQWPVQIRDQLGPDLTEHFKILRMTLA